MKRTLADQQSSDCVDVVDSEPEITESISSKLKATMNRISEIASVIDESLDEGSSVDLIEELNALNNKLNCLKSERALLLDNKNSTGEQIKSLERSFRMRQSLDMTDSGYEHLRKGADCIQKGLKHFVLAAQANSRAISNAPVVDKNALIRSESIGELIISSIVHEACVRFELELETISFVKVMRSGGVTFDDLLSQSKSLKKALVAIAVAEQIDVKGH